MKKLILLIISILLTSTIVAYADEIDLSTMSVSELIDLDLLIEQELQLRDFAEGQYLYQGMYEVGQDIEAGRYVFKCEKVLADNKNTGDTRLRRPNSHGDGFTMHVGDKWSVRLEDGDELNLIYLECSFVKID